MTFSEMFLLDSPKKFRNRFVWTFWENLEKIPVLILSKSFSDPPWNYQNSISVFSFSCEGMKVPLGIPLDIPLGVFLQNYTSVSYEDSSWNFTGIRPLVPLGVFSEILLKIHSWILLQISEDRTRTQSLIFTELLMGLL